MSQTLVYNTLGVKVTEPELLYRACSRLGLAAPKYVERYSIGSGPQVTGYGVQLPGWRKLTVFDTETGECFFDNWPVYGPTHPDVVAGTRKLGEEGRWGDIKELTKFQDNCAAEMVLAASAASGMSCQVRQLEDGALLIEAYA